MGVFFPERICFAAQAPTTWTCNSPTSASWVPEATCTWQWDLLSNQHSYMRKIMNILISSKISILQNIYKKNFKYEIGDSSLILLNCPQWSGYRQWLLPISKLYSYKCYFKKYTMNLQLFWRTVQMKTFFGSISKHYFQHYTSFLCSFWVTKYSTGSKYISY